MLTSAIGAATTTLIGSKELREEPSMGVKGGVSTSVFPDELENRKEGMFAALEDSWLSVRGRGRANKCVEPCLSPSGKLRTP